MSFLKFIFILLITTFLQPSQLQAQAGNMGAGGDATGSGGTLSYSLGQVVYTMDSSAAGTLVKGVQQPYEISILQGITRSKNISLACVAYPNPTANAVILSLTNYPFSGLSFELYDTNNKLLESNIINSSATTISLANYASGLLFLTVKENNLEIISFKIIKTNQ